MKAEGLTLESYKTKLPPMPEISSEVRFPRPRHHSRGARTGDSAPARWHALGGGGIPPGLPGEPNSVRCREGRWRVAA